MATPGTNPDSGLLPSKCNVFIAHAGENKRELVGLMAQMLGEKYSGVKVFLDEGNLKAVGSPSAHMIPAIRQSAVVVLILSPFFVKREWCMEELRMSLQRWKAEPTFPIIPVFAEISVEDLGKVEDEIYNNKDYSGWPGGVRPDDGTLEEWAEALRSLKSIATGLRVDQAPWGDLVYLASLTVDAIINCLKSRSLLRQSKEAPRVDIPAAVMNEPARGARLDTAKTEVIQLLEQHRVVVLHGMGGVGKSTLARLLYQELMAGEFALQPCIRCELDHGCTTAQDIVKTQQDILHWLEVEPEDGRERKQEVAVKDAEDGRGKIRELFQRSNNRVLVLLDDVASSKQLQELLPVDFLQVLPRGSKVLITSRNPSLHKTCECLKSEKCSLKTLQRSASRNLSHSEPESIRCGEYKIGALLPPAQRNLMDTADECLQDVAGSVYMGAADDVQSLGCMMYQMFAGRRPFEELMETEEAHPSLMPLLNALQIMAGRRDNKHYRPPFPAGGSTPRHMQDLIRDCWRHNPDERPTMEDAVERIRGIVQEQQGSARVDAKSDVFSLGSVLYRMFTGQRPFEELEDHGDGGVQQSCSKNELQACVTSTLKHTRVLCLHSLPHTQLELQGAVNAGCVFLSSMSKLEAITLPSALKLLRITSCPQLSTIQAPWQPQLAHLNLHDCDGLQSLDLSGFAALQTLQVTDGLGESLTLPASLKTCSLERCNGLEVVQVPAALVSLSLSACSRLAWLMVQAGVTSVDKLTSIDIQHCELLATLSLPSLQALSSLKLSHCPRLSSLPSIQQCSALEVLDLKDCNGTPIPLRSLRQSLHTIWSLWLSNVSLPDSTCRMHAWHQLADLRLHECSSLSSLDLSRCGNLRRVSVSSCCTLGVISVQHCQELLQLDVSDSSRLRCVTLAACGNLAELALKPGLPHLKAIQMTHCRSLQQLDLTACAGLTALGVLDPDNRLNSLSSLDLTGCHQLKHLELQGCNALNQLDLSQCSGLTSLKLLGCHHLSNLKLPHPGFAGEFQPKHVNVQAPLTPEVQQNKVACLTGGSGMVHLDLQNHQPLQQLDLRRHLQQTPPHLEFAEFGFSKAEDSNSMSAYSLSSQTSPFGSTPFLPPIPAPLEARHFCRPFQPLWKHAIPATGAATGAAGVDLAGIVGSGNQGVIPLQRSSWEDVETWLHSTAPRPVLLVPENTEEAGLGLTEHQGICSMAKLLAACCEDVAYCKFTVGRLRDRVQALLPALEALTSCIQSEGATLCDWVVEGVACTLKALNKVMADALGVVQALSRSKENLLGRTMHFLKSGGYRERFQMLDTELLACVAQLNHQMKALCIPMKDSQAQLTRCWAHEDVEDWSRDLRELESLLLWELCGVGEQMGEGMDQLQAMFEEQNEDLFELLQRLYASHGCITSRLSQPDSKVDDVTAKADPVLQYVSSPPLQRQSCSAPPFVVRSSSLKLSDNLDTLWERQGAYEQVVKGIWDKRQEVAIKTVGIPRSSLKLTDNLNRHRERKGGYGKVVKANWDDCGKVAIKTFHIPRSSLKLTDNLNSHREREGAYGEVVKANWDDCGKVAIKTFHIPRSSLKLEDNLEGHREREGGYGKVVKANWDECREVAIKTFHTTGAAASDLRECLAESLHLRQLKHHNVVRCYGILVDEDGSSMESKSGSLVMEWVEGRNLYQWLREECQGDVSVGTRVAVALQVAAGMRHLHQQGVVHGDIKPQNVMVALGERKREESEAPLVKICNFGLAKHNSISGLSTTGATAFATVTRCSELYCSPERLKDGRCTKEDDIYGFGMLMYFIATSREPFHYMEAGKIRDAVLRGGRPAENLEEWVWVHQGGDWEWQAQDYAELAMQCWHQNSSQRPASGFDEIYDRLQTILWHGR